MVDEWTFPVSLSYAATLREGVLPFTASEARGDGISRAVEAMVCREEMWALWWRFYADARACRWCGLRKCLPDPPVPPLVVASPYGVAWVG